MTTASVDGGPDEGPVLKEVRRRHGLQHESRGLAYDSAGRLWHDGAMAALSDLGEWLKLNEHPTPARDAALREEGRVQGLREAAEIAAGVVEQFRGSTAEWTAARVRDAIRTLLATKPAPDASQGSAPCLHRQATYCPDVPCPECPPAAHQGSPLPGQADEPDTCVLCDRPAAEKHAHLFVDVLHPDAASVLAEYGYARNPPEGGALEGELAERLEHGLGIIEAMAENEGATPQGNLAAILATAREFLGYAAASKASVSPGERTWQQERADVVAYLRRRVERWRPEATANSARFGQLVDGLAFEGDEIEDGKHEGSSVPQSGTVKEGTDGK